MAQRADSTKSMLSGSTYANAKVINQIKSEALIVICLVLFQLIVPDIPRAKRWQ